MSMHQSTPRPSGIGSQISGQGARPWASRRSTIFKGTPSQRIPFSLPPSSIPASPIHNQKSHRNLPDWSTLFNHDDRDRAKPSPNVFPDDDPFGFFAAERKLKATKSLSRIRKAESNLNSTSRPNGATAESAHEPDNGYDSWDELYAPASSLFPTPVPIPVAAKKDSLHSSVASSNLFLTPTRKPGKRQASSAISSSSSPRTSPPQLPHKEPVPTKGIRTKRARKGKENPSAPIPAPLKVIDSNSSPRTPLAAKVPPRRSNRTIVAKTPTLTKRCSRTRAKLTQTKPTGDDMTSDSERETSDSGGGEHKMLLFVESTTYKAERESRKAYFKQLEEYHLETEDVYCI